jgi:hypothetical protein
LNQTRTSYKYQYYHCDLAPTLAWLDSIRFDSILWFADATGGAALAFDSIERGHAVLHWLFIAIIVTSIELSLWMLLSAN